MAGALAAASACGLGAIAIFMAGSYRVAVLVESTRVEHGIAQL